MELTQSMQAFILHWGDMGNRWGLNRSVAQIHALLHLSSESLCADEIVTSLNLARSNVSTGLKELQTLKLVQATRKLGDRRDYFHTHRDMFDLVRAVVEARREREFAPTIAALPEILARAKEDRTPTDVQQRMTETIQMMKAFQTWYVDVAALPRTTQLALIKTGAGIAKVLPKSNDA